MIRPFVSWWFGELVALLPVALQRGLGLNPAPIILRESGGLLTLLPPIRKNFQPVAWGNLEDASAAEEALSCLKQHDARQTPLIVELDARHALTRTIHVPRTAEAELKAVLSFEIERHTPYHGDEVHFSYKIDPGKSNDATLAAEVTILPKVTLSGILSVLENAGYPPRLIQVRPDRETERPAPAFDRHDLSLAAVPANRMLGLWGAVVVILGIVAVSAPLISLRSSADDLRRAVAAAGDNANPALRVGEETDRVRRAALGVIRAKSATPAIVETINDLSKIIPDGTWLRLVSFVDDELVIEGLTDSTSKLVGLLEGSPQFADVAYTAPVTRERGGRLERFSFSMKFEKAAK